MASSGDPQSLGVHPMLSPSRAWDTMLCMWQDAVNVSQPGATDVEAALREWFGDEQLLTDQDAFVKDLLQSIGDQLPSLDGTTCILGPTPCTDGSLSIYTAPLATAPEGFKVHCKYSGSAQFTNLCHTDVASPPSAAAGVLR